MGTIFFLLLTIGYFLIYLYDYYIEYKKPKIWELLFSFTGLIVVAVLAFVFHFIG
jgi:hypothetical protein